VFTGDLIHSPIQARYPDLEGNAGTLGAPYQIRADDMRVRMCNPAGAAFRPA
jgi:hypothetical protein